MNRLKGVDVVWNLEKHPLPFKTNEFDGIYACHVMEHVRDLFGLMEELHRILKPEGRLKIWVPHASDMGALGHPDHKRFFTARTFSHFVDGEYDNEYTKVRFEILKTHLNFIAKPCKTPKFLNVLFDPILNFNHLFYEKFLSGIIHAGEVYYELRPVKQRTG